MTFSLIARCARTGQFGIGAVTAMPAVGKLLTYAWPRKGAVATQALVNPYLGIDGLTLLREGKSAHEVLDILKGDDPEIENRQFAVMDGTGNGAVWTGSECIDWAGHAIFPDLTIQGNRLEGPQVIAAIRDAFDGHADLPLAGRLVEALAAGDASGGDRKDERSSTVYVVDSEEYPLWDVRVDEHDDPIAELRRVYAIFARDLYPHIKRMSTRANPMGEIDDRAV
ncbi:DUF1028 domain-containing protein [Aliihoeflea aestuarii]|jgi:uncharacterized Ntn-hydrolase superfamily protein|uniref:DUF1028 domain-containing protein n=1 Tax=Aliihoeflea aestuarii TaxID=453840 RepID=UPI0020931479|nr:DUF1028 domain-containing protein [Aliihoeflea aestuarii]MCO6391146.1 DUF1028 domain-containing protein [Aliihoeflea aestuarii]